MKKPVVFLTRRLPAAAMEMLAAACTITLWDDEVRPCPREALLNGVAEAEGILTLLTDRVDDELLVAGPHLRIVANMAVGYDNIDLAACRRRGVQVSNTPGVVTETTADLAWALMLAAARRLVEGQKLIEAGGWGPWYPMQMVGVDIYGSRLGVVGAGRIGQAVLRRAHGFGMALSYHNRTPNSVVETTTGATYLALDELLSSSDVVVVTVPLSDETRGMFGAREFALMKPTAIFVNVARGPIVREAELVAALQAGRPQAAGIDVFEREPIGPDHPLLRLPNCVAVPHIGSATVATRTRMATLAAENLVAVLTGKAAPSLLNL